MNNKLSPMVLLFSLAAVVLGSVAGYFMPEFMLSLSFIGKLFLNSLKIIAIPFVITMIIAGVASMGSKEKVKRSLGKTFLYFTATSLTASVVGAILALIIQPGLGADKAGAFIPEEMVPHLSNFSFNNLFASFIPDNFITASVEMQLFALTLVALLLGTVLTTVDRKNKIVLDFFTSLKEMLSGVMKFMLLYIAPIGLFSLAGSLFAENVNNTAMLFSSLALFSVTIIFGLSFFALVLLPIVAKSFGNVSPYQYFTSLIPALSTAFATNSAVAALPVTEECILDTSVDNRASAFILPLGSLFNATGTALFLSASAIFIAQLYGLTISISQIFMIIGGSFLIASLTSFIPYASLFMLALVLQIANFPIHVTAGIGILILVDFLFGRLRSVVDVWSDAVGVAVLGNTFDFKTARSAKAAIPVKRTYNKSKPRTTRESSKFSKEFPKTKRENKPRTQTKPTPERKKSRETVKKDTHSPFQISPEKNYLTETEQSNTPTPKVKTTEKQAKSPVVKHSVKAPKVVSPVAKVAAPKTTKPVVKKEQPQPKRQKPIIHKIEVPPLPIVTINKTKEVPVATVNKDEDTVITKANALLSKDTIERERSKIAAQLNLMRERESLIDVTSTQETPAPEVPAIDETPLKQEDDQFTKIDFYAEEPTQPSVPTEPTVEKVKAEVKKEKPIIHKIEVPPIMTVPRVTPPEVITPVEKTEPVTEVEQPKAEPTAIVESPAVAEPVVEVESPVVAETEPVSEKAPKEEKVVSYGRKTAKKAAVKKAEETISEPEPKTEPVQVEKSETAVAPITFGRGKRKK